MLVAFAGKDVDERPLEVSEPRYLRNKLTQAERAYRMFKAGKNSLDIAHTLRCREANVLRLIAAERSRMTGLKNPYTVKP